MNNTIPLEIFIQNFGSYRNTRIPFGQPNERCFVTGSSGKGKSHILEAMQYVLGRKIENEKEFFNFEEIIIDGQKQKKFQDIARIELTLLNSGPNYIHKYPKDDALTIGFRAYRGNPKKNYRYIRLPDGTENRIIKVELKQFGDWNDPLMFIDDLQSAIWTIKSAKERYDAVSKFIGVETYGENVQLTRNEFKNASKNLERAEIQLETALLKFQTIQDDYNRFLKKKDIEEKISLLEYDVICGEIHENFMLFNKEQNNYFSISEEMENQQKEREDLRKLIYNNQEKINNIRQKIENLQTNYQKYKEERDYLIGIIHNFETQFKEIQTELINKNIPPPELINEPSIIQEYEQVEKRINELNQVSYPLVRKLDLLKSELDSLNKDRTIIPPNVLNLQHALNKQNITNDILFQTLEFKDNIGTWINFVEILMKKNKLGVVINEENRQEAEEINRNLKDSAILLSPRKKFVKQPNPEFKNWTHLLKVNPVNIRKDTIIDLMNLMFSETFFAENPKQKELYLLKNPYSKIICLDGYSYNIFSQKRFLHSNFKFYIGRGAIEKQKEKILKERNSLESQFQANKHELHDSKNLLSAIELKIKYLEFRNKENNIKEEKKERRILDEKIDELHLILSDPQKQIKDLGSSIENAKNKRNQLKKTINTIKEQKTQIQSILTTYSNIFEVNLLTWFNAQNESITINNETMDIDAINIVDFIKDENYLSINKDIEEIVNIVEHTSNNLDQIKKNIEIQKGILDTFKEIDVTIIEIYNKSRNDLKNYRIELEQYKKELEKCEEKFDIARNNLENALLKWQKKVNDKFQTILKGLELDGHLEFTKSEKQLGDYVLNILVSNSPGGSLDPLKSVRLSKGEKLRVSISFEMAILGMSESQFFIWDEFDQSIGDDHRELLANMIETHLPDRKLIAISPRTLIPGYIRIFPLVITVSKNDDGFSQVTRARFTDNEK